MDIHQANIMQYVVAVDLNGYPSGNEPIDSKVPEREGTVLIPTVGAFFRIYKYTVPNKNRGL